VHVCSIRTVHLCIFKINLNVYIGTDHSYFCLSLVHTVPVYAPVSPGSLQPADRGEPGRIGKEFECVHTFPAVLRTRPGFGQKVITVCPGYATVCDGTFPVYIAPEALRCVPVRPDTPRLCPGHRRQSPGVTTASDGSRTAKPRCYTVAYEYQWNSRGTYKRYVICKVQKSSYILRQKRTAIRMVENIDYGAINKTLTFYTRLSLIKKLLRIIQINWLKI